jgi:hypothetical protein
MAALSETYVLFAQDRTINIARSPDQRPCAIQIVAECRVLPQVDVTSTQHYPPDRLAIGVLEFQELSFMKNERCAIRERGLLRRAFQVNPAISSER